MRHVVSSLLLSSSLFLCGLTGCGDEALRADAPFAPGGDEGQALVAGSYVPGEVIVKLRANAVEPQRTLGRAMMRAARVETIVEARLTEEIAVETDMTPTLRQATVGAVQLLTLMDGRSVEEAVAELRADPDVEYAEPNFIYRHEAISNDTYVTNGTLWGMYGDASSPASAFGSQASEAWAAGHTGSASVLVGIIDEGVMAAHQDLGSNVWTNPNETVNFRDDDANGYRDDTRGWDFAGNNNTTYDGTSDDHGTHVAGTIGGLGGNGKGVAGVTWSVKMIPAKFLGSSGGTTANAIKAVDYITALKTKKGLDIVATNNSWGGGGFSQGLKDAIDRAGAANILFVAAAGNGGGDGIGDNNDAVANYPSNYTSENVIAVAAIAADGSIASFSNYGATTVDIGAPGVNITSTLPGSNNTSKYGAYSGTSMATPHVTGALALRAASFPERGLALKAALLAAATPTPSLAGKCVTGGRLDASGF